MSVFTAAEIAYFGSQRLGRIATVGESGQPHAVPVGFRYNPETDTIDIGGHGFAKSKKFRDARANPRVAFVVDDLATVSPWRPRGIEIRGVAEVLESGGETFGRGYDPQIFRVRARRIVSWGLAAERRSATVRP
jgi:pyridoxamine 5'-phosphate oxidase family protein